MTHTKDETKRNCCRKCTKTLPCARSLSHQDTVHSRLRIYKTGDNFFKPIAKGANAVLFKSEKNKRRL